MKKYIITLSILTICSAFLGAQNIKKAYKNMEKKEYEKAKEGFSKILAENGDDVASNFGYALILADDSSSYFNIIDAWEYIEKINGKTNQLSQEEIEIIGAYFMNTEIRKTSRPVKKKIAIAIEAIEDRLIKYVREENDLAACYEILERYPDFRYYDNVVHIRNQFEFRKYERSNTMEAYSEFLDKFPESAQVEKAVRNRNRLAFSKVKQKNTTEGFNTYLADYPNSEYRQTAIKLRNAAAYSDAVRVNTLEAFDSFVANYPEALEISEAKVRQRELLYQKAKAVKTLEAYNEFISRYPEGTYYVDIFNLKAKDLGIRYIREYGFQTTSVDWVRAFDHNGQLEDFASLTKTTDGGFVIASNTRKNDSAFSDTWVLKIDATGKMLWNKIIGQVFEDQVLSVYTTTKDEVVVVGYTYMSPDSASRMGWMFKLGSDGKKIWNKNLGKVEINASAIDQQDNIFLSTRNELDTLLSGYYLQSYNTDGAKEWERTYTLKGDFNDICFRANNSALLLGSNWVVSVDENKYIQWEDSIARIYTGTIAAVNESTGGSILYEDSTSIQLKGYGNTGKSIWKKNIVKTDSSYLSQGLESTNFNDLLYCDQTDTESTLMHLDALTGNTKNEKKIPQKIHISSCINQKGTLAIILGKTDIVLINYNSMAF